MGSIGSNDLALPNNEHRGASSPLVSIVTPSYQAARFIRHAIQSVASQDHAELEHIVVDGGSTDGTTAILGEYSGLRWISEPDRGQSQALNKGFAMARGEIVGWLNADDTYMPDAIATAARFLARHPDADAVYGDMQQMDEQGKPLRVRSSRSFELSALLMENYINQPTVFFRKSVIEQLHGVDEGLHYSMDRELWLRMGSAYRMQYLAGWVGANFRVHTGSKTRRQRPQFHAEWAAVVERSFSNPAYADVPLAVKRLALQQAQVRLGLARLEGALSKGRFDRAFVELCTLLARHWRYVLRYPLKKARQLSPAARRPA